MNKKTILVLSLLLTTCLISANAETAPNLEPIGSAPSAPANVNDSGNMVGTSSSKNIDMDTKTVYYPNATLQDSINKYKRRNYTGCLQELFSYVKKHPSSAPAYYYMALAYTQVGDSTKAVTAYEKVISLNSNSTLTTYAKKGKDCLTGGPLCHPEAAASGTTAAPQSDLDKFINAPYGNGLSPQVNQELQQKELERAQKQLNSGKQLNTNEIQKMKDVDNKGSVISTEDRIVSNAVPTQEEILSAIDTLKRAGLNFNIQPTSEKAVALAQGTSNSELSAQNNEYAQLSALLGNKSSGSADTMQSMMPYLMNSDGTANKNINPQVIENMLMSSMMGSFDFGNNNNNNDNNNSY